VEPGEGYLACGWIGKGRLAEPAEIVSAVEALTAHRRSLVGKRILITAGPTLEDVDPVRFIGNRSSGRMGFAIAAEASRRGADVTLVAGPTAVDPPPVTVVRVRSAVDMQAAVADRAGRSDVVIMAAAVADYMPAEPSAQKISKSSDELTLRLKPTPDILGGLGRQRLKSGEGPVLVGFAAETSDLLTRATEKLTRKHVDLIVANDVSRSDSGFDVDTNQATLIGGEGIETLPLQSKTQLASVLLDRVERLLEKRAAHVEHS
jgi:phosphopantothenoylcysteine decarboxylase/phosphopantothenate--cysteine ligase